MMNKETTTLTSSAKKTFGSVTSSSAQDNLLISPPLRPCKTLTAERPRKLREGTKNNQELMCLRIGGYSQQIKGSLPPITAHSYLFDHSVGQRRVSLPPAHDVGFDVGVGGGIIMDHFSYRFQSPPSIPHSIPYGKAMLSGLCVLR